MSERTPRPANVFECIGGFLRKLNEDTLALERKTPEGVQTITFLQSLRLLSYRKGDGTIFGEHPAGPSKEPDDPVG